MANPWEVAVSSPGDIPDELAAPEVAAEGAPPSLPLQPNMPTNKGTKAGLRSVLAGMLQNFSYGAGQAMKKEAGLPTDAEIAEQNAKQAFMNAQTKLMQEQAAQAQSLVPIQLPDGTTLRLPQKLAADLYKEKLKNIGKVDTAKVTATAATARQEDQQAFTAEQNDINRQQRESQFVRSEQGKDRRFVPQMAVIETVDAEGKPVRKIVPKIPGVEYPSAPTAEQKNKTAMRGMIGTAVDNVEALGKKVITEKTALAQKAVAAGRKVEAVLGDDPEYLTYQASRMALAGNLAVAQQGSRPSDADIKAIWLPLVPDVFTDTEASSKMKWEMIRTNSGLNNKPAAQPSGQKKATHRWNPQTGKIEAINAQ